MSVQFEKSGWTFFLLEVFLTLESKGYCFVYFGAMHKIKFVLNRNALKSVVWRIPTQR
jgi:hypothetical protein